MKKLLLITGDLATGKSTFAQILSRRYNANAFYKDAIKEVLGDTIGFSNREENLKLSKATMELLFYIFNMFGKLSKNLILEANFHEPDLDRLHQIASDHEYEVLILVLSGNVEILHKRYLNRIYHENRHPVHLSTTFDRFDDFKFYINRARKEEICGNTIHINADDFSYQTDEKLLAEIDAFMTDK